MIWGRGRERRRDRRD